MKRVMDSFEVNPMEKKIKLTLQRLHARGAVANSEIDGIAQNH